MEFKHYSVLLNETIEQLHIRPDGIYVDGTLGGGGHSLEICRHLTTGRLIGIDQDADAIAAATERLKDYADRVTIVRSNYAQMADVLKNLGIEKVDGIILDLGVSSFQLDTPERGFTYRSEDAPLDMRMDKRQRLTARDIATVVGQIVAALIVMRKGFCKSPQLSVYPKGICFIYKLGIPNILMQSAYTFYILGLNLILATFSDQAVTALGLYYKWQSFFFIPLGALQTCIVPVISYNYASGQMDRCKKTLSTSLVGGMGLMFIGTLVFNLIPGQMLRVFTSDPQVIAIGTVGFHFVGISFIPMVTSLIFPVFFQAVGAAVKSSLLTVVRTMILFVPLGYLFSRLGLNYFWFTFPVTEVLTTLVGVFFYRRFMAQQK